MSCRYSRDTLALHAAGDLSVRAAAATEHHLERCVDCRRVLDELRGQRRTLQELRRNEFDRAACLSMRRAVMSAIHEHQQTTWSATDWWLRLERMLVLGVRQHAYAAAACVLIGIASVSAMAQMRYSLPFAPATQHALSAPIFEGADTLVLPADYRDWVAVRPDALSEPPEVTTSGLERSSAKPAVYVNPAALREFRASGTFPEGTVFLWVSSHDLGQMSVRPHGASAVLLASVKDSSRFDDGWGFFDFTASDGGVLSRARALPASRGCRSCHRGDAAVADPVLVSRRSART